MRPVLGWVGGVEWELRVKRLRFRLQGSGFSSWAVRFRASAEGEARSSRCVEATPSDHTMAFNWGRGRKLRGVCTGTPRTSHVCYAWSDALWFVREWYRVWRLEGWAPGSKTQGIVQDLAHGAQKHKKSLGFDACG